MQTFVEERLCEMLFCEGQIRVGKS